MHTPTPTKRWLTAITAATLLLITITATTATARNLSISEQGFRATFNALEFTTAFASIRCRVTLEGSFHSRTVDKVVNRLMGAINAVRIGHPCTNGEAWADNGVETQPLGLAPNRLPFHLQWLGFTGRLPNIEALIFSISRSSYVFQSTVLGLTCRGRSGNNTDAIAITAAREAGGGITSLVANGNASLVEQLGPNAVCPATGGFHSTGAATNSAGTARLTVTLI